MSENTAKETAPISTTVQSPEPWRRVVQVEISRDHFDGEYASRLKKAVKTHQKPGFRKGRIPPAVVEKELGEALRADTIEALVSTGWMTGVLRHRLAPITDPALDNLEFPDGGPLKFELSVEVRPDIEQVDCEGIAVRRRAAEVADADVEQVLERLRESRATFSPVERAAAEGDQILLDLTPHGDDGAPDVSRRIADQRLVLGAESNLPAFNEGLAGAAAGQEREVGVVYPDEHPNERLKGRTLVFSCQIREVAERRVPDLNDAFAGQVAPGKTLDELRAEIRSDLLQETERRIAQELDQQILAELIRRNAVPVPPSMLERYLESGLEELHRRNLQTGRANTPEEDARYRETGRSHAETALQGMLLVEAVQRQHEIKVTPADVDERIEEIAAEHGFEVDRYREFVNSGDERGRLEYDLLERRTYDFLLSRAEIEPVPADTDVLSEKE